MRRYLGRRAPIWSPAWWLVWAVGALCLLVGDLMGRPNAVHGLGVLLIGGLAVYELIRLVVDVWRLVTR